MDCPHCGFARSQSEKECPRCIYIANTVREQKQKQPAPESAVPTPKRAICHSCGQILEYGVRFCKDCGASQTAASSPPDLSQTASTPPLPLSSAPDTARPTSNTVLISIMWTLTAVQIVLLGIVHLKPPMPYWLELPAFVIAVILIVSRNGIDRGHGWANLTLEGVVLAAVATTTMLQYR